MPTRQLGIEDWERINPDMANLITGDVLFQHMVRMAIDAGEGHEIDYWVDEARKVLATMRDGEITDQVLIHEIDNVVWYLEDPDGYLAHASTRPLEFPDRPYVDMHCLHTEVVISYAYAE
jgi:hypothetical protein